MSQIFDDETFAVVDLETTGTQRENGNHIIQFGCAIVKKMKVVKTYSFMINPNCDIPMSIKNLTGITNEDVANQPDFSHYAQKIVEILEGTTFVAHNVAFDLPFLNYELTQHGYEALTNRAIDTVELAKIAFPTLPSYKLSDLTSSLGIKHTDPHKADSDAYGTAILLIECIQQFEKLPQATLNTLSSLARGLIRDTSWIFKKIADDYRQHRYPLSKDYIQIRNIVLQRQIVGNTNEVATDKTFPTSDAEKRKLLKGKLNYRQEQIKLINKIHQFVDDDFERAMIVESPNGTGKTFSYLFAYAYSLYSSRKLVIATPTKILQEQIFKKEIPQLLDITKLDIRAEIVKSSRHYIDLDGFVQSIFKDTQNRASLVLKMRILVWLTKTKTGDLDELQLTSYNSPLFNQITHPGDARVGTHFAKVDFWNLARQRQETADILITNHAYLANHFTDNIWGQNPYLVIDEAHRFSDNVLSSRNDALQFEAIWGTLSHLRNLLTFSDDSIQNILNDDLGFNLRIQKLDSKILDLIYTINSLQKYLYYKPADDSDYTQLPNNSVKVSFLGKTLFPDNSPIFQEFSKFEVQLEEVRQATSNVMDRLYQEDNVFIINNNSILNELTDVLDQLDLYLEKSYQFVDMLNDKDHLQEKGFILNITNNEDPLSTNLHWLMLDVSEELEQIYSRFDHLLFISATLTDNDKFDYSIRQLAIEQLDPLTYIGNSTFNFEDKLKAFIIEDMPDPNSPAYADNLAKVIAQNFTQSSHVLVLMTNLDQIKQVFEKLVSYEEIKDYELLGQGVTGSNNKIAKRFSIAPKAILLGADSFWEGIDFHDCGIDDVIVTRLPFESPDLPEVHLRQEFLANQNINFFENDTLPRAVIRFRQGIGRLIRGEYDSGRFTVLDSRILTQRYGHEFIETIPVEAKIIPQKKLKNEVEKKL